MVSGSWSALQCRCEISSRANSNVGRLRESSELRQLLAKAGVLSVPEEFAFERAEFERCRMVGSGGFLRPGRDLRDAGTARHESLQLFDCGPVESRRMGARAGIEPRTHSVRAADEQGVSR